MTSISASIPSHNSLLLFGHDTPAPFEFHEFTTVTSWISLIIFTLMALIRVYKLLSIRSIIIEFVVSASITVRETHFYDIHKLSWINSKIYTPLANTNVCLFVCLLGLKSWYIQINYLLMTTTANDHTDIFVHRSLLLIYYTPKCRGESVLAHSSKR